MQIAIGIILIISAIFLVVAVLMQHGKDHNLSGTIAGGAETFFGKSKASTWDKRLSKMTTVIAIVFTVLVLVSYLMQDTINYSDYFNSLASLTETEQSSGDDVVEDTTDATDDDAENADTDADADVDGDAEVEVEEETAAEDEAA